MLVKVLEDKILEGADAYFKDEVRDVPDEMALGWIGAGWAEDATGEIPTGERKNKGEDLIVNSAKVTTTNKAV